MPQAQNLIIKDASGTDRTFELITPASGDGAVAQWAYKAGPISSVFPLLTAAARPTGNKSRQLRVRLRLPSSYTDSVTGRTVVASGAEFNGTFAVPDDFPEALKPDFVAFTTNALKTALLQAMIKDATPAT